MENVFLGNLTDFGTVEKEGPERGFKDIFKRNNEFNFLSSFDKEFENFGPASVPFGVGLRNLEQVTV